MRNEGLICLTENTEVFEESIFNNKDFRRLYNKVEDFIDIIFFTDRQTFSKDKHSIFFSFDFDSSRGNLQEDFANINEFVHLFIDILCTQLRFSNSHINQSLKLRGEFMKLKEKENAEKNNEEYKKKKLEKIEKLKDNKIKNKFLTKEQAILLEEKERKEQLKLTKPKVKLLKK
jgi:hypothetical protein